MKKGKHKTLRINLTQKTETKQDSNNSQELPKNNFWLFQNIPSSVFINILVLLFTAIGTYIGVTSRMDSRLESVIDTKASKHQEKLNDLILKFETEITRAKKSEHIVALISDFGTSSYYPSVIKGKIYQENKRANIVDITHNIKSFDVIEGSWILFNAAKNLPDSTIIWGMVNSGAKLKDSSIFFVTDKPRQYFVGASRSLFDDVITRHGLVKAYQPLIVGDDKYGTATFTKLITILQRGGSIEELIDKNLILPLEYQLKSTRKEAWNKNKTIVSGHVCAIDRWGNILTNIGLNKSFFKTNSTYSIEINSNKKTNFVYGESYSAGEKKNGVLIEQDGWIHVAIYLGRADTCFKIDKTGCKITIRKEK